MKRKVAFISEHASPLATLGGVDSGGQNVYVGELARHLVRTGYQVDIFTRWDNEKLPEVILWVPGVRVIHVPAGPKEVIAKEALLPFMTDFTANMISFIIAEKQPYPLIHSNFWMSALVALNIRDALQIPFVVTFHALGQVRKIYQGDDDKFPPERIEIEKRIVRDADHIIAECPQDLDDLVRYYAAEPSKITIIPCGFNPNEFYPVDRLLARMVLKLDPGKKYLLQLGRMVPRKGVDNVIRALGRLSAMHPDLNLLVVGGQEEDPQEGRDEEINRLREIAAAEGVSGRIHFAGRKSREILRYYYAAADIFITTPWYEPFGITPLEAMACGTPVIGSAVGGIKYSVEDGKTGCLVPPNNPQALADRIQQLITTPDTLDEMRRRSIRRANRLFTWSTIAEQVSDVYQRTIYTQKSADSSQAEITVAEQAIEEAIETLQAVKQSLIPAIMEAAGVLTRCFAANKKVLICGNGGSAAESQHMAAELVGRFELAYRRGLPAITLTADSAVVTAWSNDIGFDDVFARQVQAFGQKGDVLFCFSTSGQSPNIIQAVKMAVKKGMTCIALSGKGGGVLSQHAQVVITVPSFNVQRIQEAHLHILHTLCGFVETQLFGNKHNGRNGHAKVLHADGRSVNGFAKVTAHD
ncbi:MAG TPA: glycosyltransferase [Ohtaekwangia sp.]|nr:glycosyltransferase [Ohtaekwangia sp.]